MALGQSPGPPATYRQVQELLGLLQEAGHADFRDARKSMRFTQRQAGGKFTRDEADAFIEQLQADADGDGEGASATAPDRPVPPRPARLSAAEQALRKLSDAQLAAELQRRGWIVVEP